MTQKQSKKKRVRRPRNKKCQECKAWERELLFINLVRARLHFKAQDELVSRKDNSRAYLV